jgi:hypothetical protein
MTQSTLSAPQFPGAYRVLATHTELTDCLHGVIMQTSI